MPKTHCFSLSGYLTLKVYKCFRLIATQNWFVFDDTTCQLFCYTNEQEFLTNEKNARSIFDISRSILTVDNTEPNQFKLLINLNEYTFQADNKNSFKIWVTELQKKRDAFNRQNMLKLLDDYELINISDHSLYNSNEVQPLVRTFSSSCSNLSSYDLSQTISASSISCCSLLIPKKRGSVRVLKKKHRRIIASTTVSKPLYELNNTSNLNALNSHSLVSIHCQADTYKSFRESNQLSSDSFTLNTLNHIIKDFEKNLVLLKRHLKRAVKNEQLLEKQLVHKQTDLEAFTKEMSSINFSKIDQEKIKKLGETHKKRQKMSEQEIQNLKIELSTINKTSQSDTYVLKSLHRLCEMLKGELNTFKKEYLFVLQSFVNHREPSEEIYSTNKNLLKAIQGSSGADKFGSQRFYLYGGDKHINRIRSLLDESREIDPSLPSWQSLIENCFIDKFGFKHERTSDLDHIHYACQQLGIFYSTQSNFVEEDLLKSKLQSWRQGFKKDDELKRMIRSGIASPYRKEIWEILVRDASSEIKRTKGPHYYSYLCNLAGKSSDVIRFKKQIHLDLKRTLPNNTKYNGKYSEGIGQMQQILEAFCVHNPEIGYCQGMNLIVAVTLLFLKPEDSFWCLVTMTEKIFRPHYFDNGLIGSQADQMCLKEIIRLKLPDLHTHLEAVNIDLTSITLNWFLSLFVDALPFDTLIRIWDCFLLEGDKVLFRFACALLTLYKAVILKQSDAISLYKHLKYCVKNTFDIEGLTKIAFVDLQPFPSRTQIREKQDLFGKLMSDTWLRRQQDRDYFYDKQDQWVYEMNKMVDKESIIEYCTFIDNDEFLACFGGESNGQFLWGSLKTEEMFRVDLKFDSKIICLTWLSDFQVLLVALLSGNLMAIDGNNKDTLWKVQLGSSILTIKSCHKATENYRVYCGLSDGSITVFEMSSREEPQDIFDIQISKFPIAAIELVTNNSTSHLWIAAANVIHVVNEINLATLTQFEVSPNQFDQISAIISTSFGVWLAVRGSTCALLYDDLTYQCQLIFDTLVNCIRNTETDDCFIVSQHRITAMLVLNNLLWVGTGNGYISIYSIFMKNSMHKSSPLERGAKLNCSSPVERSFDDDDKDVADVLELIPQVLEDDAKRTSNAIIMEETLEALELLYAEKSDTLRRFNEENKLSELNKLDKFNDTVFSVSSDSLREEPIYFNKITLPEYSSSSSDMSVRILEKLEIVEPCDTDGNTDDLFKSNHEFDTFFTRLIQTAGEPNLEREIFPYSPVNVKSKSVNSINSKLVEQTASFLNRNQTSHAPSFSNSSIGNPREWYSVNSVMDLSERYISHFEAAKTKIYDNEMPTRELKNYRLIKAYLKIGEEACSKELDDIGNHSMPELNWSERVSDQLHNVDSNLFEFHNDQSSKNELLNAISSNCEINRLQNVKNHLYQIAFDLKNYQTSQTSSLKLLIESSSEEPISNNKHMGSNHSIKPINERTEESETCTIQSATQKCPSRPLSPTEDTHDANKLSFFDMDNSSCDLNDYSMSSDTDFYELELLSKVKCCEQPIRSIVSTNLTKTDEQIVISCSGNYGDDESILKWQQTKGKERCWVNAPMIEICPVNSVPIRPMFARISYIQSRTN